MPRETSKRHAQKTSFKNEDLSYVCFYGDDLRGVDFSGADLSGATFINVRTGILPVNLILIFIFSLLISALSGYIAMLGGDAIQVMVLSNDAKMKGMGIGMIVIIILFIVYCYWKGGADAFKRLLIPIFFFSVIAGGLSFFSGPGSGSAFLFQLLSLILVVVMFMVGTIARATAGRGAGILFLVVAATGIVFAKSPGGAIESVCMAVSCALISRRATTGAKGFGTLRKIAAFFTAKFGTSFRNCILSGADFSLSKSISNTDFTHAETSLIFWGDAKKLNCLI
jgi:hypothetical protein